MKIVIAGGGAAGMLAALAAKTNDNDVCLIEKNEKLGKMVTPRGYRNV